MSAVFSIGSGPAPSYVGEESPVSESFCASLRELVSKGYWFKCEHLLKAGYERNQKAVDQRRAQLVKTCIELKNFDQACAQVIYIDDDRIKKETLYVLLRALIPVDFDQADQLLQEQVTLRNDEDLKTLFTKHL
jgi:hypothetical protein